jgi:hypothetical protein
MTLNKQKDELIVYGKNFKDTKKNPEKDHVVKQPENINKQNRLRHLAGIFFLEDVRNLIANLIYS